MNKKLRVGVVGVGHLGKFHAEKYHKNKNCLLHSVSDTSSERGISVAERYNCSYHADYKSMVGMVDAVSVAVPTTSHFKITDFFLSQGIHVLVEKPITDNIKTAQKLLERAKNNNLILLIGHLERFNPCIQSITNILSNRLDNFKIKHLVAMRLTPFNTRANDVSVVTDLMIHDIDLANFFLKSPMKSVQSKNSNVVQKSNDVSSALLTFADGSTASFYANRIAKEPVRQFELYSDNEVFTLDLNRKTIHHTKFISNNNLVRPTTEHVDTKDGDALENEIKAFIDNIITGKMHSCSTDAKEGIEALRIAELIDTKSIEKE
ncbi:Gfo/Idh/MocA family oxidoreductase [Betaproteobacteria bacterium]|nr:Gfo/Idh/MocA family oxidoreductase [Betaproteobacteria bacterium]